MNCFPCCGNQKDSHSKREHGSTTPQETIATKPDMKKQKAEDQYQGDPANIQAQYFTFRELATATKNFRQECLLGEAGFGRVYKGIIPATGQVVAVKQLDRHGTENSKEFLVEVACLSLFHHDNLVNLIGYCADGDQRLLVYEYFPGYTLEDRLFDNKTDQPALNWFDRMKVAAGASQGLEYLHNSANPPVIYRDLKAFNILMNNELHARLYDFGMAKLSGSDKMNHAPPRVMGTYGYCAPECVRTGLFTLKSDVYSFGVVLLELITGRRAIDTTRPNEEQNLVSWAQPLFRDPKRYPDMADPVLNKQFPEKDLNQAVAIAAMCLQEEPEARPLIGDVVTALSFLSMDAIPPSLPPADSLSKESYDSQSESERDQSETETESESGSEYDRSKSSKSIKSRSKTSRKSSTRTRNGTMSSDSGDGSSVSNYSSNKSSRKWHGMVDNINQKSSGRELSKKKSSVSKKSSGKSFGRVLSRIGSDDGSSVMSGGSSSCYSSSVSDYYSRRTEESMRLDMGSEEGSARPFDRNSSSGSER